MIVNYVFCLNDSFRYFDVSKNYLINEFSLRIFNKL